MSVTKELSTINGADTQISEIATKHEIEILPGFGTSQSFALLQRIAQAFAASNIVPNEYRNNLPNCMIAINMANRLNTDPLMVMQNLYIVLGRPSWSSAFLISSINSCGRFTPLQFEFVGEKGADDYGCRASAIDKSTGKKLEGSLITIKMSKSEGWYNKSGSKWQTMPEQMLRYRSAAFFQRIYCPEITMGMHTTEELQDMNDIKYAEKAQTTTISDLIKTAKIEEVEKINNVKPEISEDTDKFSDVYHNFKKAIASITNKSTLNQYLADIPQNLLLSKQEIDSLLSIINDKLVE